ncbi:MAG TPA: hypothetical protein VFN50_13250 [Acidimicrobiales bacterium]|nr:hypothetical protein [Acidimicrobiales bacterium]
MLTVVVVAVVVGSLLVLAAGLVLVVGLLEGLLGEYFGRCPHCGRVGATVAGRVHPEGCPVGLLARTGQAAHRLPEGLHLRHH